MHLVLEDNVVLQFQIVLFQLTFFVSVHGKIHFDFNLKMGKIKGKKTRCLAPDEKRLNKTRNR